MTARKTKKYPPIQYRTVTAGDDRRDRAVDRVEAVLTDIVNYELPEKKGRALKAIVRLRKAIDNLERVLQRM